MEKETNSSEVKKSKSKQRQDATVPCLKCGVLTNLNAFEMCIPCRTKKCKDCGDDFLINKNRFDRCSDCQSARKKRVSRHLDI